MAEERRSDDVEELREVLEAVSDFLDKLGSRLKSLLDSVMESLDGAKLGREVGEMYKSLKEAGVPEEVAIEMTREFFKRKMELAPTLSSVLQSISSSSGKWGWRAGSQWELADKLEDLMDELEDLIEELPEGPKKEGLRRRLEKIREGEVGEE